MLYMSVSVHFVRLRLGFWELLHVVIVVLKEFSIDF